MLTKFTPFTFETAVPETVGIDSTTLADFEAAIREAKNPHQGYMIYKDGKLVASSIASPYRSTDKRHVYSVSKTWTSTAIGIAVDEGLLSVEDQVISFFPELLPENVSENLAKMKVKHLLSMNSGHHSDTFGRIATAEPEWARRFLALEVEHEPGTHFMYNTTATYMLSAILTKITGLRMTDYLRPRLFNPLGIEGVWWDESPEGIDFGGWGIHVSAEDMLKLGVLYLNKGVWNGKRILSEEWIAEATSSISDNSAWKDPEWSCGYGYQIWRCKNNSYRADGAYGQYIIVSPDKNCVTVIISDMGGIIGGSMQNLLDFYWDNIYCRIADGPLPVKPAADTAAHPYASIPCGSREVAARKITLADNAVGIKTLEITPMDGAMMITAGGDDRYLCPIVCGFGEWERNRVHHCPFRPGNGQLDDGEIGGPAEIAAAYAVDGEKLAVELCFVTTPHCVSLEIYPDKVMIRRGFDAKPFEVGIN